MYLSNYKVEYSTRKSYEMIRNYYNTIQNPGSKPKIRCIIFYSLNSNKQLIGLSGAGPNGPLPSTR